MTTERCQGMHLENIFIGDKSQIYPNPSIDDLNILIGGDALSATDCPNIFPTMTWNNADWNLYLYGHHGQNWGDIYINSYGGFGGYVSNIRYLSEYISISELEKHFSTGPTGSFCVDSGNKSNTRYLSSRWILNN